MGVYLILLVLAAPMAPPTWPAQDRVAEARRLRDGAEFARALKLLEMHLQQHPDDVEAARLRAQTLYWLKAFDSAHAAYAEALRRHPDHQPLRLEYARMLVETGRYREAMKVLEERHAGDGGSAEASALKGTMLYWQGDLTSAKRHFEEALRLDPGQQPAARQLGEIRLRSSPWVRVASAVGHDDQPIDRLGVEFEAGWFVTPLMTIALRSEPSRYTTGSARTFWLNEVTVGHVAPRARVETRLGFGALRRPASGSAVDWTGHALLGIRVANGVTLRGRLERSPYLYTAASLETPIMTRTVSGRLHLDTRGWLAEALVQRQAYPDANAVRSAHGWLLAPLVTIDRATVQAGYAVAAADAEEDRFVLARPQQPFPPEDPRFDFSGVYDPYYTPIRSFTHSAIAALRLGRAGGPTLRASGSYGFWAREDARSFYASGGAVVSAFARRSYTPWTVRGSVEFAASSAWTIGIAGESGASAYYRWTSGRIELTHRFARVADSGGAGQ